MDKTRDTVSILISTKNRLHDLEECIDSILIQTVKPGEIILVDASDTHESMEMVKRTLSGKDIKLTYHRQPVISGKIRKTAAWNRVVKTALGDIIIFLDDDIILDKDYIYYILKAYHENVDSSVVGIMGRFKDLSAKEPIHTKISFLRFLNKSLHKLFLLPNIEGNGCIQPSGFPAYPSSKGEVMPVEIMPTGNMSIKKWVFQEFTFDEWFHGYSYQEDDDFSYRVSRKYKFLYTPFAELIHKSSQTARDNKEIIETMRVLNHYYFFKKNMPKSLKNCLAFVWSELGLLFFRNFSFSSFKDLFLSFIGLTAWKNIPLIKARVSGYQKILHSLILKKDVGS